VCRYLHVLDTEVLRGHNLSVFALDLEADAVSKTADALPQHFGHKVIKAGLLLACPDERKTRQPPRQQQAQSAAHELRVSVGERFLKLAVEAFPLAFALVLLSAFCTA